MIYTDLSPIQIAKRLSNFAKKEHTITATAGGFVSLLDPDTANDLYGKALSALPCHQPQPIDQPSPVGFIFHSFESSPSRDTVWLINDKGSLLGALQKSGSTEPTVYTANDLSRLGRGAEVRKLLHETLNQMNWEQPPAST
jgi:hypothetical protein